MTQTWHNLLFAHWPLPVEAIQRVIPPSLEVDTYDGQAWVGVIPFRLSGVRLRGCPEVSVTSHFPEINVRTYVTHQGKPGVCFLSLDADNRLAIALAKPWFRLPYLHSRILLWKHGRCIHFTSQRLDPHEQHAEFCADYGPISTPFAAAHGSLEHWLTERYCYYASDRRGHLYRCEIHHPPWSLQRAEADITINTMALSHGLNLPATEPLLHYAHHMRALIWPLSRC